MAELYKPSLVKIKKYYVPILFGPGIAVGKLAYVGSVLKARGRFVGRFRWWQEYRSGNVRADFRLFRTLGNIHPSPDSGAFRSGLFLHFVEFADKFVVFDPALQVESNQFVRPLGRFETGVLGQHQ